jgi:hypothetical protein
LTRPSSSFVAAAALAFLGAGCGGGGGGPAPIEVPQGVRSVAASAGADVTSTGFDAFAGPLARAVMSVSSNGVVGTVAGGREAPQAAGGAARAALAAPARWALAVAGSTRPSGREQAQAVSSETIACPFGGSMTISVNDADNNQELSAGDSVTLTAFSCVLEATLPMANGGFAMTINAVELDSNDEPTALDATASFSNFTLAGFGSMNGAFRLWTKTEGASERIRINYQALVVNEGQQTVTYDFDAYGLMSASGGSFDLNGGLRLNGQTYSVVGGDVFSFSGDNPPGVGSVRLIDAAGDALKLSARSASTLDLEFFPAGSAAATASLLGQLWSSFRQ